MASASLSSFFTASHFCNGFNSSMVTERASRLTQVSLTQLSSCKTVKAKKRRAFEFACESTSTNTKDASQITSSFSSSPNSFPIYDRLLPCPSNKLPPRIEHLVVTEESRVSDFICKALDLPPLFVADLIRFGAVHHALVHPEPPPSATVEDVKAFKEATAPLALRRRVSLRGKTIREAQKTARIVDGDQLVEPGAFLRVHVHPKRYPRCYEIDWKSRIIAANESFVVLDKPSGTSVGGNVDNLMETCTAFAAGALGLKSPLRITHQIDNCTEGCIVLAKTKKYSSVFHEKIRERTVKKLYLALAAAPLPIGTYTHYMRPNNKAPRLVSEDFIEGWHVCKLEIIECVEIPWPSSKTEKEHCGEEGSQYWPRKDNAYECRINLLTGRTHQIRAQLAALGAPIVGDSAYMPAALAELANSGTNPFGKYGKKNLSEIEKETAVEDWIARHGKEPSSSIGLQACQISWDEGKYVFQARTPWWRC